jgi:NAD-dependent deacetylase
MEINTHRDLLFELKRAEKVLFYTGADISADAGLATFYNPTEIWEHHDISELSSRQGFENDPETSWKWYQHRRRSVANHGATKSHFLIKELSSYLKNMSIITQNVDCLHQISGSKNVLELHGNIFKSKCIKCDSPFTSYTIFQDEIPSCDKCGGYIRPNVVWFGEAIDQTDYNKASLMTAECDVFVTIGIYQSMFPAKELISIAKENGAFMLEISKSRSINTDKMDRVLNGKYSSIIENIISDYKNLFIDN